MSVITVHSVTAEGKHTIAAFQDVNIVQNVEPPSEWSFAPRICRARDPLSTTYEIHGANGYEVHEGGSLEEAYMSLLQSQAEKIAELERDKRFLQGEANRNSNRLDDIKDQIRIAIGDKEEPEEEEEDEW